MVAGERRGGAAVVQRREADAMVLEAVGQGPGLGELQARGDEQSDFLRDGAGEDPAVGVVAAEGERREGRGLEG